MKFVLLSLALLGAVAGDVSHLNNEYLPPHLTNLGQKNVGYEVKSQVVPQVSQVEINDNSVANQYDNQESTGDQQYYTGKVNIDNLNYGPTYAGDVQSQVEEKKYYATADTDSSNSESSVPVTGSEIYPLSQGAYWTQQPLSQDSENNYYTGFLAPAEEEPTVAVTSSTVANTESVAEEPEKTYYTGLITPTEVDTPAETSVPAPGSDSYNQDQGVYWTQQAQNPEPEDNYYTGLIAPAPEVTSTATGEYSGTTYYNGLGSSAAAAPAPDSFTQQQSDFLSTLNRPLQTAKPSFDVRNGGSSGIDTKYGSNGGYVY